LTATDLKFSAWTLPMTRTRFAFSVALVSTLSVPLTRVPLSVQVAPSGTRRLSNVLAPIVPRQVASSARAGGAPAKTVVSDNNSSSVTAIDLRMVILLRRSVLMAWSVRVDLDHHVRSGP
jgi:hypothetical protein